ncbi:MAG: glycosyl hydrolase, partial [Bacteroidetes bacterium]|nr:glycosyl hydrolase [Bacteroidota bacterium]
MSLKEKIGQLTLYTSDMDQTGAFLRPQYIDDIKSGSVGSIFNAYGSEYTRKLQEMAVNGTRLGIPLLFGYDVIHGHRTIFPVPLAEAASWDLQAIKKAAEVAAAEAASEGLHWTFAPMADIARDP